MLNIQMLEVVYVFLGAVLTGLMPFDHILIICKLLVKYGFVLVYFYHYMEMFNSQ